MKRKPHILFSIFLSFMMLLISSVGNSLCIEPQEVGNWKNANPNTNSITRANIDFYCQDQILNGVRCCPTGPPYGVQLFGKCTPTDCPWGTVRGNRNSAGQIYVVYYMGYATRYVYAKMSAYRPGQLWIYIRTDFTDPARADYVSENWFVRA